MYRKKCHPCATIKNNLQRFRVSLYGHDLARDERCSLKVDIRGEAQDGYTGNETRRLRQQQTNALSVSG